MRPGYIVGPLDPTDRFAEVVFGVIMAMTFTGTVSVASAGEQDIRQMLYAALGCNLAWGIVDAVMYVMTYPMEFRDIQSCYPILFTKDPNTGSFFSAAVLGFEADQNLFLQGNRTEGA